VDTLTFFWQTARETTIKKTKILSGTALRKNMHHFFLYPGLIELKASFKIPYHSFSKSQFGIRLEI